MLGKVYPCARESLSMDKCGSIPANIISCNYEDVLTGREHVLT